MTKILLTTFKQLSLSLPSSLDFALGNLTFQDAPFGGEIVLLFLPEGLVHMSK